MLVESANYGDFNKSGVFHDDVNGNKTCSVLSNCQVKSRCGGKRSCELAMNSDLLPSQYCPNTSKQIYTKYICVDTNSSTPVTTGKVQIYINNMQIFITIKSCMHSVVYTE